MDHPVMDPHTAKTLDKSQPGTCHAGNVESLCDFLVIVIQIQSGCPQIELIRLIDLTDPGCKYGMDAGRQGGFMHVPLFIILKILPDGIHIVAVFKEI
jgi:hypothetical protein